MQEAELTVGKEFIVKQEQAYEILEGIKEQKDKTIDELKGKIMELELEQADKQREIERLLNREDQLETKEAELTKQLVDTKSSEARLQTDNRLMKNDLRIKNHEIKELTMIKEQYENQINSTS